MQGIEGYRLLRQIGAGGMGTVHEAVDADGTRVAVKVIHSAIAADPAARARLRREVDLLHRVRDAGVARVLDAEVDGVDAFVVTELIDGPTLEDDIRVHGPLEGAELAGLAHGLAAGLHAIHAAGVTHRDLKPGNVMLSPRGPVIIDFGIAQVADDVRLTQTGMVTGTPGYLDPAVIAGGDPGPAGDWWAWAAVLAFAGTGRPPFGRGGLQAVLARVSTGVVDLEGLPERLATVLRAALDPEPARRLTPNDVLAALDGDWDRPALTRLLTAPSSAAGVPPSAGATHVLPPPQVGDAGGTRVFPAGPPWARGRDDRGGRVRGDGGHRPPGPQPRGPEQPSPQQPWPQQRGPEQAWPQQPWPAPGPVEPPAWARPPRRRTWTVAALGLAVSAVAVPAPGWWMVGVAVLLVLLGGVGRGARRLRQARLRRGPRRGDVVGAWAGTPVHLLWAAGAALPGLLLAVVLAAGTWWIVSALLEPPEDTAPWLLWAAAAAGLALAWTVPTSLAAREGARTVLGALPPPVRVALVLLALAGVAVVAAVVLGGAAADPLWTPLPEPPV